MNEKRNFMSYVVKEKNGITKIIHQPKVVGYWVMPCTDNDGTFETLINTYRKPNFIHRYFMKLVFGFNWRYESMAPKDGIEPSPTP